MSNQDKISELSDDLILLIWSFLPKKVVVATSVLSKRWKLLWKKLPELKFISFYHHSYEHGIFSENVIRALLSHMAPVLQSLHLNFTLNISTATDIRRMITIAISLHVRELVLIVHPLEQFILPKSLYNCEKLETLELKYLVLKDVPSSVCLKNFRTLHLKRVQLQDTESFFNLLSGCPNLEDLVLITLETAITTTLTIAMPSLQRLTIYDFKWISEGYVISSPSLKYLKISGLKSFRFRLIENLPELEEAHIKNVSDDVAKKILRHLTSAKRLCLELDFQRIKFPNGRIFYQLTYLELKLFHGDQRDLLTLMLDSSPKLQILKLIGDFILKGFMDGEKWNQPKKVPECLLFHLETFIWQDFNWDKEDEIEIARYILGNTNHLKKAFIYTKAIDPIERVAMVKDLNTVIMASNSSCQLQVI